MPVIRFRKGEQGKVLFDCSRRVCISSADLPLHTALLRALLDPEPVRDQRDELAVGRLVIQTAHVLAEGLVEGLKVQRMLQGIKE